MAEAIKNVTILLDRLYNLKGDENVLIKDLERQIGEVEKRIDELDESIAESTSNKRKEEEHLSLFLRQKDQFETLFSSLTNDSFSALEGIEVFLDVGTLKSNVEEKSPAFIRAIMEMIDGYKTAISDAEEARREAETQLANLRIDVATVSEQRNQLISLLEQSLSPNEIERESLTANFVKQVLIPFGVFTTEEIAKLTKIIMFPDEGLLEYDRMYEERVAKGLIGFIEDESEEVVRMNEGGVQTFVSPEGQVNLDQVGTLHENPAEEPAEEQLQAPATVAPTAPEVEAAEQAQEDAANEIVLPPIVETVTTETSAPPAEDLKGPEVVLNFEKISEADLEGIIASKTGAKASAHQAEESLHGKVEDANIYLICKDVAKYEDNLETLLRYGINIDDKEVRNFMAVLFESINIAEDSEILKDYLISILKSNGKYALSVFWKKPEELLADIDDLVEAGLENVIAAHPEILGINTESILRRIKYCEANKKKVFTDDMRSDPYDYIMKINIFKKEISYGGPLPELGDRQANNAKLMELIGNPDYVEILLNTLSDYYANTDKYSTPQVVDSMKEKYDELIHYLEDKCKAEIAGKFTYKVKDVCICKNKLERNIAIILNALAAAGQPAFGVEREIVLVSALYNSRLKEETLEKVVGSCLGFNQAAQEVTL